jgi:hypothetical protein
LRLLLDLIVLFRYLALGYITIANRACIKVMVIEITQTRLSYMPRVLNLLQWLCGTDLELAIALKNMEPLDFYLRRHGGGISS